MKKFIIAFFTLLIIIIMLFIFNNKDTKGNNVDNKPENQIVEFGRNKPTANKTFSKTIYKIDLSNNKVKKYEEEKFIEEYELSSDQVEWLKVSIDHCFENEERNEEEIKKQSQEYYLIKVDDTILLENRVDRVKQATENIENRKDEKNGI